MLLAARPCTKARKDFPALVRPVAVRQRAPASDAMSMSAEPTAASDQLSGRSLPGITLSEGEPGASDLSLRHGRWCALATTHATGAALASRSDLRTA